MAFRIGLPLWAGMFLAGQIAFAQTQTSAVLSQKQVAVETRVVVMSEDALAEIRDTGDEWRRITWRRKNGIESALLDDAKLYGLLMSVQGNRRAHSTQLPKITMFDRQQAKIAGVIEARFLPAISGDERSVSLETEIVCKNWQYEETTSRSAEFTLAVMAKVPDQRTIAITAKTMTIEAREEQPSTSPLSRIPYVHRLVRNIGYSRETFKVIVLVTPRIVREEHEAEVQPLRTGQPR